MPETTITLPSEAESEIPTQTPTASSTKGGALQGTVTVETKFGELEVVTLKIPLINVGVKAKVSVDPKISLKAGEEGIQMRAVRMTVEVSAGPAAVIVGYELTPEELLLHFLQSCQHAGRVLDEHSTNTTATWVW